MSSTTKPAEPLSATWLTRWEPEDPAFWSNGGSSIAWRSVSRSRSTYRSRFKRPTRSMWELACLR